MIKIPTFQTISQRNEWLVKNKGLLIDAKKSELKKADAVSFVEKIYDRNDASKEITTSDISPDTQKIRVKLIINTTGILDSHSDVHIKGLWNKSLKEVKSMYLLKMHRMDFDSVISDEVKASAKEFNWSDLDEDFEGTTQALLFDAVIDKEESAGMFEKYVKGKVKNHSVGMRYVKAFLAINEPRYKEEYEIWEKYYPHVANKSVADERGYFFAVTEAKVVEGSAVLKGSNEYTPTTSIEAVKMDTSGDEEPPAKDTRMLEALNKLLTEIKS